MHTGTDKRGSQDDQYIRPILSTNKIAFLPGELGWAQIILYLLWSAVMLADIVRNSRAKYQPCVVVHRFCPIFLSN